MTFKKKLIIGLAVLLGASSYWDYKQTQEFEPQKSLQKIEQISVEPYITCPQCSPNEQKALKAFQDRGITDRYALAALMGNVKQESKFFSNICEGGARVNYEQCHRGGYGLIQWTTVNRYDGLGRYARTNECNPSTTDCQLGYLFTEYQWKKVEPYLKQGGKSIEHYMQHCYKWLGWGVHGFRTDYAYDYTRQFDPHAGT